MINKRDDVTIYAERLCVYSNIYGSNGVNEFSSLFGWHSIEYKGKWQHQILVFSYFDILLFDLFLSGWIW